MRDLMIEYLQTKQKTQRMIECCQDESELKILNSILKELEFIIKWIRTGHDPTDYKGIHKLQCYVVNPETLEAVIDDDHYSKVSDDEYSDYLTDEKHSAYRLTKNLTARELEVFLMIECEKMRYQGTAELLEVSKGTVQKTYERARKKVDINLKNMKAETWLKHNRFAFNKFEAVLRLSDYDTVSNDPVFIDEHSTEYFITMHLLSELKTNERKVLLYTYCSDLSIEQIAKKMKMTVMTIENNLIKATNKIKHILGEEPITFSRRVKKAKSDTSDASQKVESIKDNKQQSTRVRSPTTRDYKYMNVNDEVLLQLPEREREAFILKYKQGMMRKDIAIELSLSVATIDSLLYKARMTIDNIF